MNQLKLSILASDVEGADYFYSSDCPITRAFHRAGKVCFHTGTAITEGNVVGKIVMEDERFGGKNNNLRALGELVAASYLKKEDIGTPNPDFDFILEWE